jgi:hypothetical protein
VIFKALVLQALYNLSDDQAEYQLRDRLSFMRFLGLGIEDPVPDAKTLWLYREALAKADAQLRCPQPSSSCGWSLAAISIIHSCSPGQGAKPLQSAAAWPGGGENWLA